MLRSSPRLIILGFLGLLLGLIVLFRVFGSANPTPPERVTTQPTAVPPLKSQRSQQPFRSTEVRPTTPPPTTTTIDKAYTPPSGQVGSPDLVIESLQLVPEKPTMRAGMPVEFRLTLRNIGSAPTTAPFWVDLALNPTRPPTSNTPWNTLCGVTPCQGVAWRVTRVLMPGEELTLTTIQPEHTQSVWDGWLPSGTTTVVAYADSWGEATGALAEGDETNNRAEISGLQVTGVNPPNIAELASRIPPR